MKKFHPLLLSCCCLAFLLFAGCGPSDGMVQVSGTVSLDGQPLDKGAITFTPTDGKSPTAGATIEAGKYTTRVPKGTSKVSITSPKEVGKRKLYNTPDSPETPIIEERIPAKYNQTTELTREINGDATLDFELKTTP
jgi:hypothetical protein